MNRLFSISFFLLAVFMTGTLAEAQISINEAAMQSILVNSKRMEYYMEYAPPPTIDLGSASGSSQTFDFSVLTGEVAKESLSQNFVEPAGQPGASEFPGADLCTPFVVSDTSIGASITSVSYFVIQADGFYLAGTYTSIIFPPFPAQLTIEKHEPPQLLIPLPLTYGTSRTAVDTVVTDTAANDYTVTTTTVACDGWGDVTFPSVLASGAVPMSVLASCLRATQTSVEEDYTSGTFSDRRKSVSVTFLTADGTLLTVEQEDTSYAGGNASVTSVTYSMKVGTSDVRQVSASVPEGYSLSQNYPNPFNPSTTIAFTVPAAEHVSLKVYDLLGREVAALVDTRMAPGSYEAVFDAAGVPSGMYIYRIVSGGFSGSGKMNVVK